MSPYVSRQSPARRAWRRFRSNRLGYASLLLFAFLFGISLLAEVLSNDKPLAVRYEGHWYFPLVQTLPETTFGGDFETPTDYLDPLIQENLAKPGNMALFPPNRYHHSTINYFASAPSPAPPDAENLLGTDDRGRDLLARLLYGFRISVVFALLVTAMCAAFGVLYGAIQGYFAGWTDIAMERVERDLERHADAVHADHFLVAVRAELLVARHPAVDVRLARHRRLRARGIPQEQDPRLRARREGAGAERREDHAPPHPAQQPDAGRDADPVRDGRGHRRADQPGLSGPRRAARHAQPRRAAQPGQETTWMRGGYRCPPSACW